MNLPALRRTLWCMRRRFQGLVIIAVAVAAAGLAYAQSADLVLCDRVAADPALHPPRRPRRVEDAPHHPGRRGRVVPYHKF